MSVKYLKDMEVDLRVGSSRAIDWTSKVCDSTAQESSGNNSLTIRPIINIGDCKNVEIIGVWLKGMKFFKGIR